MTKTIYKYPVQLGSNTLQMPLHSQILTAQLQYGVITIWAIVDESEMTKEDRNVVVFGTGHPLPVKADVKYWIATVQQDPYVWHLFEFARQAQ